MSTHVVESTADEYNRLVGVAQTFDELVQDGCRRAGLHRGGSAAANLS